MRNPIYNPLILLATLLANNGLATARFRLGHALGGHGVRDDTQALTATPSVGQSSTTSTRLFFSASTMSVLASLPATLAVAEPSVSVTSTPSLAATPAGANNSTTPAPTSRSAQPKLLLLEIILPVVAGCVLLGLALFVVCRRRQQRAHQEKIRWAGSRLPEMDSSPTGLWSFWGPSSSPPSSAAAAARPPPSPAVPVLAEKPDVIPVRPPAPRIAFDSGARNPTMDALRSGWHDDEDDHEEPNVPVSNRSSEVPSRSEASVVNMADPIALAPADDSEYLHPGWDGDSDIHHPDMAERELDMDMDMHLHPYHANSSPAVDHDEPAIAESRPVTMLLEVTRPVVS
ncbi:unnamed protein product [Mycena citricolor]|uniref:Transmembrane protein n=1 Tax=Mycena citricolor TaxID=2018698 RepID=A0AAD2H365_9AGAR|nr:unnamed protein product [Mycena citricolor]